MSIARERAKAGIWMSLIALLVCGLVLMLLYSQEEKSRNSGERLPPGSTNVEKLGNGWYEFDYKSGRYLYHNVGFGDSTRESLVRIDAPRNCACARNPQRHPVESRPRAQH